MDNKDWNRPKKPYTVTPDRGATYAKPYEKKPFAPKPKSVIVPAKNNANNKVLHDCMKNGGLIKLSINNLLCGDPELNATYEGKIKSFDDFTLLLETPNGSFLINKSSIAVIEFVASE